MIAGLGRVTITKNDRKRVNVLIRMAEPGDAARIAEIYAPYVLTTAITFEYDPPSSAEMASRIASTLPAFPYLVWEENGVVLGYAYAHPLYARAAYQWNAELSVYVEMSHRGKGIGGKLYRCMMEILKLQNIQSVYACITEPNPGSIAFHHALGFSDLALYPHCGFKHGKWYGVNWLVKHLTELSEDTPAPRLTVDDLSPGQLADVMAAFI